MAYKIEKDSIHKTRDEVKAILNASRPANVSQVEVLLDLVTYYSKFVPNLSTTAYRLNQLLRKDVIFIWPNSSEQAFKETKGHHIYKLLIHFNPKLTFV